MTDPTSYAAGIEAAARVADTASRLWGSDSKVAEALSALAEDIRSLAPERGGGSGEERYLTAEEQSDLMTALRKSGTTVRAISPALPAAPSGWRCVPVEPTEEMIHQGAAMLDYPSTYMGGPSMQSKRNAPRAFKAMLAAAPPAPVPARDMTPAECAEMERATRELHAEFDQLLPPPVALNQAWITALETAFAAAPVPAQGESGKASEYEKGELFRLELELAAAQQELEAAEARADRLTTAAQAARDALEPIDAEAKRIYAVESKGEIGDSVELWQSGGPEYNRTRITYGDLRRAREALASLASALDEKP